jgi:hypothetical protein
MVRNLLAITRIAGCRKSARPVLSGDGKRTVAACPKLPRPSSTLLRFIALPIADT